MKQIRFRVLLFTLWLPGCTLIADSFVDRVQKLDRNGDGQLSREEAPKSFRKFKFDHADRNKDGFLDKREMDWVSEKLATKKHSTPAMPSQPVTPEAGRMTVVRDIVYRKDDNETKGRNKLDIDLPRGKTGYPVLFWIHGGGLHSGDKSKIAEVAGRFVAEGIGVVSANYRLYPEAIYPVQIEDVADAFSWVHRNIANRGGDPEKLFVSGGSAGGHLTALLTLNDAFLKKRGLTSGAIRGSIPISGLMDVSRVGGARRKGVWGEKAYTHRVASPLNHARKDAPPLLLLHAEHDTLDRRQQNQAIFVALKKAGHPDVAIHELKDRSHNSIRPNLADQNDTGAGHILKFIRRLCAAQDNGSEVKQRPWSRHTIDSADKATGKLGADGVRLADFNGDGLLDIATGWEQGGAIVVYQNPGPVKAKSAWPSVTVGRVSSPEDAVFADLDGDGNLDVVSSCEGRERTMFVHWAPAKRADYLKSSAWVTEAIPATKQKQSWMFAEPAQIDGRGGIDLFVSSKGANGSIGWLRVDQETSSGRDAGAIKFVKLRSAGWIMTLKALDMDGDGDSDLLFSDRKGGKRGVSWLANPGGTESESSDKWTEHAIGGKEHEVMFLSVGDLNHDGVRDIVCPTRNGEILLFEGNKNGWNFHSTPNPFGVPHGKAVAIGDIDNDGQNDLFHVTNTGKNRELPGATWMSQRTDRPWFAKWNVTDVSGSVGVKFDLVELVDLDGDGDLDAITCEEVDNLGVFWFENPLYDSSKLHRSTSD